MPVSNCRRPSTYRSKRERLAAWLILGCVSGGLGLPAGVSDLQNSAMADGLEWVTSPRLTNESSEQSNRQSIRKSNRESTQRWDSPSDEFVVHAEVDADTKIPARLPTKTVHSVLGIRGGSASNQSMRNVGTSIELMPPQRVVPPQPVPSPNEAKVATRVAPRLTAPAQLVTRENSQILGFQRSWQPSVPVFTHSGQEMVLRAAEPVVEKPLVKKPFAEEQLAEASPAEMPPHLTSGHPSIPAGQRRYTPAFVPAKKAYPEAPGPLRDPAPMSLGAPSKTASKAIGSGVKALSPINEMPSLDELEFTPTTIEAAIIETELTPPARQIADVIEETTSSDQKRKITNQSRNEGDNEGNAQSPEVHSVEPETSAVDLPADLSVERFLEADSEQESAEGKDTEEIKQPSRVEELNSSVVKQDSANETRVRIKKLTILPSEEVPSLQSAQSRIEKESVFEDEDIVAGSTEADSEDIDPLPVGRLSQLDATGRIKNHSGATAVEKLSPTISRMRSPILRTLQKFHAQTEHADSRSNWGMMHQIMVYGADTRIIARRRNYSAIAWMAGNNVCRGNRLLTSVDGNVQVREGTGLQGHQAQFLAVMSLAGVPSNYPLYVGNERFSIKDLVEVEATACDDEKELTFTLIGLAHYLDTSTTWAGVDGQAWDFERLIAAELSKPIVGEACGGTHRLMAFAHALRKRRMEGKAITGQWQRAEDFLDDFTTYTFSLQNRDGSTSTNWFESPQDNGDLKRKVQTTGHMVEFLLTHLPDSDLADQRITRSITFLVNAMNKITIDDSAVGYRGHALRSLAMYHRRMYGVAADYPAPSVANQTHQRRHVRRKR